MVQCEATYAAKGIPGPICNAAALNLFLTWILVHSTKKVRHFFFSFLLDFRGVVAACWSKLYMDTRWSHKGKIIMFLRSNLCGYVLVPLDTCTESWSLAWLWWRTEGQKHIKNCLPLFFFLSSEVIYDAHDHVIPGLRQSREETCRLFISYQILMDQLGHRNPFWRLSHVTYVRFFIYMYIYICI